METTTKDAEMDVYLCLRQHFSFLEFNTCGGGDRIKKEHAHTLRKKSVHFPYFHCSALHFGDHMHIFNGNTCSRQPFSSFDSRPSKENRSKSKLTLYPFWIPITRTAHIRPHSPLFSRLYKHIRSHHDTRIMRHDIFYVSHEAVSRIGTWNFQRIYVKHVHSA